MASPDCFQAGMDVPAGMQISHCKRCNDGHVRAGHEPDKKFHLVYN